MTSFVLKLIAMVTMVVDHTGAVFFGNNMIMRIIGRLAFLTYAFLMAEGYYHLKNKPDRLRSHVVKLCILALITEIPHDLCHDMVWLEFSGQNAVFTLLLGFAALIVCGWIKRKFAENKAACIAGCVLTVLVASALSYFMRVEYAVSGILFIVMSYLYLCKADEWKVPKRLAVLLGMVAVYLFFQIWTFSEFGGWNAFAGIVKKYPYWIIGSVFSVIPMALYNRKLGYHAKWFGQLYSIFYPLQFAVIVLVMYLNAMFG